MYQGELTMPNKNSNFDSNSIWLVSNSKNDKLVKVIFEGDNIMEVSPVEYEKENDNYLTTLADSVSPINIEVKMRPSVMLYMYGIKLNKFQAFILDMDWRIRNVLRRIF